MTLTHPEANGHGAVNGTNGKVSAKASTLSVSIDAGVAVIAFSGGHRTNPFSQARMVELKALLHEVDANDHVRCIVLHGGAGRFFSAGGDFNETSSFTGGDEIDAWIDAATTLYMTILGTSAPVIAAVDHHAVGIGLQIALSSDYRIGSDRACLMMPELKMGISCNLGSYMLETVVGRPVMQKMVFTAGKWRAPSALRDGLLHEVVPADKLLAHATEMARTIATWNRTPVAATRGHMNAAYIEGIRALGERAKTSHRASFADGVAQTKMKHILTKNKRGSPSWILATNCPDAGLAGVLQKTTASGIHVYGQGAILNSGAFVWDRHSHDELGDDDSSPETRDPWAKTSMEVRSDVVRMRTGALNDPPLFMTQNTTTRAWAVSTDVFALNVLRAWWGMPVGFVDPTVIGRNGVTSFLGVTRLPAHANLELQNHGSTWSLNSQVLPDPLAQAVFNPTVEDFAQAGKLFVNTLREAIVELTGGSGGHVATMLSGGIDSGAVTTLAVLAGLKVTAYSAGTPWGNEHAEAKELTDFLGIPHVQVDLSADEFLAAVPESVRALGTADHERVDIMVTITALLRGGFIKESHVLTGYGNDLLNLGLPPDSQDVAVLQQDIIDGIDITRHSGEFTDVVARQYGKQLSHPYWHSRVVQAALQVHPALKIQGGREKAFFRAAMEPYVPYSSAWRQKIGIHLGGGLQGGLDALFGGRAHKAGAYCDVFKAISTRLLHDPFATVTDLVPRPDGHRFCNGVQAKSAAAASAASWTPVLKKGIVSSGAGLVLDGSLVGQDAASVAALGKAILRHLKDARFIVVKKLKLDEDSYQALVRQLGEPVPHKFLTGTSSLMKLPATRDKGHVVLGRGMLPFHTDGIFVGHRPDVLSLYAAEFSDVPGSGETVAVDQVRAVEELPPHLREGLQGRTLEYQIVEEGHLNKSQEDEWFSVPLMTQERGRDCLGVSMPFPDGAERSWNTRVQGASPEESRALLGELDDFLSQKRYCYSHRWEVGDMLILDNYRTLHGRTAIGEDGQRCLWRGQVNRRVAEAE